LYIFQIYKNTVLHDEAKSIELAKQIYENLSVEAKQNFVNILEEESSIGYNSLLKFHTENIDKTYNSSNSNLIIVNKKKQYNSISARSMTLAQELSLLALPKAVEYSLLALPSALGVPVGNVVDVVIGLGVVTIIVWNWKSVAPVWDDIVDIFSRHIGGNVVKAFDYIYNKATGLPTDNKYSRFNYHYDKHSAGFQFMPGGNGNKPDKKKFWEMAKKALKKTGSEFKQESQRVIQIVQLNSILKL
jgi:hypothetical protein